MPGSIYMNNLIRNLISWRKTDSRPGKPTAVLHIGVEKTGTTTIQEFLHLNRKLLAEQGIWLPGFMNSRNHRQLAVFCCHDHKSNQFTKINNIDDPASRKMWKHNFRVLLNKEMRSVACKYDSVIFSSEHLSTLLREQKEIQCLKKLLESYTTAFVIIVYIRRQDLVAGSMINNAAKAGHGKVLPKGDGIFKRHFYNYDQLLKQWSAVFGQDNIRLRIFEKPHLINGDLIQDFMAQAGIMQDEKFKFPGKLNTSLSATAVDAAWLFNKRFPFQHTDIDLKTLRNLRMELIIRVSESHPGPPKMLQRQDAVAFLENYKDSNQQLALAWLGQDQLFSEDFSMYPDAENKADAKLVKQLVDDFIELKGLIPLYE